MVHLEFQEKIKMLAVPTNDVSDQKYFVHLIRTSLSNSGTNVHGLFRVSDLWP